MPGAMLFLPPRPTYRARGPLRRAVLPGSQSNHDHADELSIHPHDRRRRWRCVAAVAAAPAQDRHVPPSREVAAVFLFAHRQEGDARGRQRLRPLARAHVRFALRQRSVLPALLRRRGGFGLPQERIQSSLGSGVIISRRRRHRHQHACRQGRRRHADPRRAVRQARVRRQDRRPGREHRSRRAQDREGRQRLPVPASSPTATSSRWATWCSPSATRSASARR